MLSGPWSIAKDLHLGGDSQDEQKRLLTSTLNKSHMGRITEMVTDKLCGFAHSGTYGHECCEPACITAIMKSDRTKTGIYYAARCSACATIRGGENAGVIRFEPLNPAHHVNEFIR